MSANTKASARSLAYLGGFMANKGTFLKKTIMSEETWTKFHANPTLVEDAEAGMMTRFTDGGVDDMTKPNTAPPEIKWTPGWDA